MTRFNKMAMGRKALLLGSAIAFAIGGGPVLSGYGVLPGVTQAFAQGSGQGGGGGGHQGQAAQGQRGQGMGSDRGTGQRGPDESSEGTPHRNQPAAGTQGGKPSWAGDSGVDEVDLGRLNVARSPAHVLDQALAEALANFDPTKSADLYSMTAEEFAAYVKANFDTVVRIDSPLENLGLYKDILVDGKTQLSGVTPVSSLDLAAIFLGSAADKTIKITINTVKAMQTILQLPAINPDTDQPWTEGELQLLADKADAVRQAILDAHG
jgi:hypothetical protein